MHKDIQLRELFHFCFLERLLKTADPALFALKGGVNLRFYFNSPRYSEDMDLDVFGGSVETLKKNGYKILQDASFLRVLQSYGIEALEINDAAKAKHTATTQRFRLNLLTSSGRRLPTKVEFSRRSSDRAHVIHEQVNTSLARNYKRLAFSFPHYSGEAAVIQKIRALAGRPATQARDVFDLQILERGGYLDKTQVHKNSSRTERQKAAEAMLSLSFDDYRNQVLSFLDEENQKELGNKQAWQTMQESLLEFFE